MTTEDFSFGLMLRHLRRDVRGLKQEQLASAMCRHWHKRRGQDSDLPLCRTPQAMRTALSKAERNSPWLDGFTRDIAAEVLQVPRLWFDNPAPDWPTFLADLARWLDDQRASVLRPLNPKPAAPARRAPRFASEVSALPPIEKPLVFTRRGRLLRELDRCILGEAGAKMIVVSGPMGVGKSTLVSKWLRDNAAVLRGRPIVAVHCPGKTGEQVIEELSSYFARSGLDSTKDSLSGHMELYEPIIVLDAVEQMQIPNVTASAQSPNLIISYVSPAIRANKNVWIIVTYADDAVTVAPSPVTELRSLMGDDRHHTISVENLHYEDAVKFLENGGLTVQKEVLDRIVRDLDANPALLVAFLSSLGSVSGDINGHLQGLSLVTRAAIRTREPPNRREIFEILLRSLQENEPASFEILQILAAARDGLEPWEIESILAIRHDDGHYDRPMGAHPTKKPQSPMAALGGPIAPMLRTLPTSFRDNGSTRPIGRGGHRRQKKFLHLLTKRTFREYLSYSYEDEYSLKLNWDFAKHYAHQILNHSHDTSGPNKDDIERLHNLLYHLLQIYELARRPVFEEKRGESSKSYENMTIGCLINENEISYSDAIEDPSSFVNWTFEAVLIRSFAGEDNAITRQLGHFEKKLSMLIMFFEQSEIIEQGDLFPFSDLSRLNRRILLTDTAICASYCGNLDLAHRAVSRAAIEYGDVRLPEPEELVASLKAAASQSPGPGREDLRLYAGSVDMLSSYLNILATVYCREGNIGLARDILDQKYLKVRGLFEAVLSIEPLAFSSSPRRHRDGILLGFRRICAKFGQVAALGGDLATADEAYSLALRVETARLGSAAASHGEAVLRGETGRSYVRMLLASDYERNRNRAVRLIELNLSHAERLDRRYERIEWLLERARILRREKRSDEAYGTISEIWGIIGSEQSGVSFSVRQEIEIEAIRIRLQRGGTVKLQELESQRVACERAGHRVLVCELSALMSSIADDPVKQELLRGAAEEIKSSTGYQPLEL